MSDDIELKFRHVSGDIGPLKVSGSSNILQVKEKLYAQWPKGKPFHLPLPVSQCFDDGFSRIGKCCSRRLSDGTFTEVATASQGAGSFGKLRVGLQFYNIWV